MQPQNDPTPIHWRLHLTSPPGRVYRMLSTDQGRAQFWAESTTQAGKNIPYTLRRAPACISPSVVLCPSIYRNVLHTDLTKESK
jgi:hypothetical protein